MHFSIFSFLSGFASSHGRNWTVIPLGVRLLFAWHFEECSAERSIPAPLNASSIALRAGSRCHVTATSKILSAAPVHKILCNSSRWYSAFARRHVVPGSVNVVAGEGRRHVCSSGMWNDGWATNALVMAASSLRIALSLLVLVVSVHWFHWISLTGVLCMRVSSLLLMGYTGTIHQRGMSTDRIALVFVLCRSC
ncbi:hypothetical protein IWX49DRAFT_143111 [Phyllosticta citricarpa]|uniref:Secreted protein n=2 Tax=Phyllosticta TaxID=121621 RepID=A0ABR1M8T5_9PEZI